MKIFEFGLTPYISLSGVGLEIFENAREIGMEKYITKIEKIVRRKVVEKNSKKPSAEDMENIIKSKKTVKVKLGPNIIHEILDALEVKH